RRVAVAAVGVLVLVAVVSGLGAALLRSSPPAVLEANAVAELNPESAAIASQSILSDPPGGLAFGFGRIWASDPANQRVLGIDPDTGSSVSAPSAGATPTAVTIADGSVWVLNAVVSTIRRIDPEH